MNTLPIGASGQIKISKQDNGAIVIDIDPTYRGQVSINTVGTIKIGDWQGNIINPEFGGTGCNNNGYLQLNGNTIITGSLIINCDNNSEITLPHKGHVATVEDSLQIGNALSEIKGNTQAYDNISPNSQDGDITYYKNSTNEALKIGKETAVLQVENQLPVWKVLPNYLLYIVNGKKIYSNKVLEFEGPEFIFSEESFLLDDGEQHNITNISLDEKISSIATLQDYGFLVRSLVDDKIHTRSIISGNGIRIYNPSGSFSDVKIEISANYSGQKSIDTVGVLKEGEWEAKVIAPQFGGTGNANEHSIKLGGNLETNCDFYLHAGNIMQKAKIAFYAKGDVCLGLPKLGDVATVQESLQKNNNLLDVENSSDAFSNISPTLERGDITARGYGNYDVRIPIGKEGEVLTVDYNSDCLISWKNLNIENTIEAICKRLMSQEKIENDLKKKQENQEDPIQFSKFLNALIMQLDYMQRTGQIKLLKEVQGLFDLWFKKTTEKEFTIPFSQGQTQVNPNQKKTF